MLSTCKDCAAERPRNARSIPSQWPSLDALLPRGIWRWILQRLRQWCPGKFLRPISSCRVAWVLQTFTDASSRTMAPSSILLPWWHRLRSASLVPCSRYSFLDSEEPLLLCTRHWNIKGSESLSLSLIRYMYRGKRLFSSPSPDYELGSYTLREKLNIFTQPMLHSSITKAAADHNLD